MSSLNNLPTIMAEARVDLSANVSGQFSPQDWERILSTAHEKLVALRAQGLPELKAWERVILDFYRNRHWGYQANYRASRDSSLKKRGLGRGLIIMVVISMTVAKIALAWLGQRYTASDEPRDA